MKIKVLGLLMISSLCLNAATTSAISNNKSGTNSTGNNAATSAFSAKKQKILDDLQERTKTVTALQTCISSATSKTDLQKCKTQQKDAKKANKKEFLSL